MYIVVQISIIVVQITIIYLQEEQKRVIIFFWLYKHGNITKPHSKQYRLSLKHIRYNARFAYNKDLASPTPT